MNTPSRIALSDVQNHVLVGTPSHAKTALKTQSSIVLTQRPSASKVLPKFLDFGGDDHFEVFEEILAPETKPEECRVVEEPIEKFDHRSESPDRFEDYLDQLRELENIVLVDEFASDDSYLPDFKLSNDFPSNFDENFDLENIDVKLPDFQSDLDVNPIYSN